MAGTSQPGGRIAQKARTRSSIVAAARRLRHPTVEQAADAARVSRATAYRYFPTQESLDVELQSSDYWQSVAELPPAARKSEVGAALERLVEGIVTKVLEEERHVRLGLRVYHDTWLRDPGARVRRGRRLEWIDAAIAPLPAEVKPKLRLALALAIGPDPVTMMKDIAWLDAKETKRLLKWTVRAILRTALEDAAPKPKR
jgi:AcrR family transcriptional regulator